MEDAFELPAELVEPILARLKLMSRCDSTLNHKPQDGSFVWNGVETRVSFIPVLGGQSVAMRLLRKVSELESFEGLGLSPEQTALVKAGLVPGLVLIVGPTGSGKTTTFYAVLRSLDANAHKIISVEDPVEQHLDGVCQVEVTPKLSFAQALRSILRQSPDVIGVGELRDAESVAMAVQAALTGHIVVATLHAGGISEVPSRLIELGASPAILSQVLQLVVAQRLLNFSTGRERHAIFAAVRPDDGLRLAIRAGGEVGKVREALVGAGVVPLREQARKLVDSGLIDSGEFLSEFGE
jgi:type II secretory ATPase GspE/PulE/Tfp pilus assembly ATPase PilB-like protein